MKPPSIIHNKFIDQSIRKVDACLKNAGIPVRISTPMWWWFVMTDPGGKRIGLFRKHVKDAYNPRRWGFFIGGLEIGSRG
jgi:hypothetical protein